MTGNLVLAMTGASGIPYGVRLLEIMLRSGRMVHLTISPAAAEVFARESEGTLLLKANQFDPRTLLGTHGRDLSLSNLRYHHFQDFGAGIASGSFPTLGMVVCPCSMGTVASIAHGTSTNLIHRAADVHLKERRKLILVPRETPLGLIHLRNLLAATEAGAIVLPAMPAFYTRPREVSEMIDFVVGRICDQLGLDNSLMRRWGMEAE